MTLIEVLFAVLLFAGIATSLMSVWMTHFHAIDQAQNLLAATSIGDGLLAEQAGLAFQAKTAAGSTLVRRAVDGVWTDYVYTWKVTVQDTTLVSPDIKNVSVTVSWKDNNIDHSLTMVTCVYWAG